VPARAPAPAAPSPAIPRVETSRAVPAPDLEPAFDPEIPGADALRRLIANVVPPSALAPSAPARAPAPNTDNVRTEVVLPTRTAVPEAVTEPASAAKPMDPAPVAKAPEAATPFAKSPEQTPAAKVPDAASAATAVPVQPAPAPSAGPAAPTTSADVMPAQTPAAAHPSVRSMDETVVELLRPLLRDWLDTNMPRLIEPALKAELEAMRSVVAKDKKG
jgi:cell pole-organizing protein PopZ